MRFIPIVLLLIILLTGCEDGVSYSLITSNKSDEVIEEVQVWFDGKPVNNGILSPGDHVTIASSNFKLKQQMKITWVGADKDAHEQVFNTFDFIPDDYSKGNVIFAYQGNDQFILEFYMPKNDFPKLSEMQ